MDGILNIYKEQGYTSHDVVAKLRGILHQKKIGHTGTLDPAAEGVLPVCLGQATKLCELLTDKTKVYRAVLKLGIATDTEDLTGKVLYEKPVACSEEDLRAAVQSFVGGYAQVPPMYSALKVDGRKLYELAREGKTIERAAREVAIYNIEMSDIVTDGERHPQEAVLTVTCGKGTYIRSLCRDIGERLGTCACMKSLVRLCSGTFSAKDSMTLAAVEEAVRDGTIETRLVTIEQVFLGCRSIVMKPESDKLLLNGNRFGKQDCVCRKEEGCEKTPLPDTSAESFPVTSSHEAWMRVYCSDGRFCGIYEYNHEKEEYRPVKMFLS